MTEKQIGKEHGNRNGNWGDIEVYRENAPRFLVKVWYRGEPQKDVGNYLGSRSSNRQLEGCPKRSQK